jgi:outer membrane protein OmpA-like peptidoglycan-associated protein
MLSRGFGRALCALCLVGGLAACSDRAKGPAPTPASSAASAAPEAPAAAASSGMPGAASSTAAAPPVQPFDEAVLSAANALLSKAPAAAGRTPVVIDPLIDGVTGAQTQASQAMGARLAALIRDGHPQYEVLPFNASSVARSPLVLLGTLTGVNGEHKAEGRREHLRIWLTLADLKTGKIVSKGLAFATTDGADTTPTAYFRDSPVWTDDPATQGYLRTCQGSKAGDAIPPQYIERLAAAAWLSEAIDAYDAGKYAQALAYYEGAARLPAGRQLRTYSGLYLSNLRLGRQKPAMEAFGQLVEQGLEQKKLGMKLLFRPGSTGWSGDDGGAKLYPLWLAEVAQRSGRQQACLEVVGHTSASGPEPLNERLSLLRAEYVKDQVAQQAPSLARRLIAHGMGSRDTLIGNGRDDATDALDRRVEFKVIPC